MAWSNLDRKQFLVSHLGWLLEVECEFSPREMTDLNDRTRLTDCLATPKYFHMTEVEHYKCLPFDC